MSSHKCHSHNVEWQPLNSISNVPGLITFGAPNAQKTNFLPRIGFAYSPGIQRHNLHSWRITRCRRMSSMTTLGCSPHHRRCSRLAMLLRHSSHDMTPTCFWQDPSCNRNWLSGRWWLALLGNHSADHGSHRGSSGNGGLYSGPEIALLRNDHAGYSAHLREQVHGRSSLCRNSRDSPARSDASEPSGQDLREFVPANVLRRPGTQPY